MITLEEFHRTNVEQCETELRESGDVSPEVKLLTKEPGVTVFMWEHWKDAGIRPLALPDLAAEKVKDWELLSFKCVMAAPDHELKNYRYGMISKMPNASKKRVMWVATVSKDGKSMDTMKSIKGEGAEMVLTEKKPGDVPWPFDDPSPSQPGNEDDQLQR